MADVTTQRYSHLTECCIMSKDVLRSRSICTEHVFLAASIKKLLVTLKSRFMHFLRTQMSFSRFYRAHLKKMFQYISVSGFFGQTHSSRSPQRFVFETLCFTFLQKKELFQSLCLSAACAVSNQDCDVTPPKPDFKHTLISCGSGVLSISK